MSSALVFKDVAISDHWPESLTERINQNGVSHAQGSAIKNVGS
jgi:hypothetical protein